MAIAVFQLFRPNVSQIIENYLPTAPVYTSGIKMSGNMASIVFSGDMQSMYVWCMNLSNSLGSYVSFIGIDGHSNKPNDRYRLAFLTSGAHSGDEREYLLKLIEEFMTSVRRLNLNDQQITVICTQCVLGQFDDIALERCIEMVKTCIIQGNRCNYRSILCDASGNSYLRGIVARFMAHICYLSSLSR